MTALNKNDNTTIAIVNTMQMIYEASEDVKNIYLIPCRALKDGTLFDEQYLLVDIARPTKNTDLIIDKMIEADDYLDTLGITTATTFYSGEDTAYLLPIPKGGF